MKLKTTYWYQLKEHLKAAAWFYGIMLAVLALITTILALRVGRGSSTGVSGFSAASVILLFVLGITSFKEVFGMLVQNGVSRRTMFATRLYAFGTMALLCAVADQLFSLVLKGFSYLVNGMITTGSLFGFVYNMSGPAAYVMETLYSLTMNLLLILAGYFLSLLFYRLNKAGKILVGAGVPVCLIIVFPSLDTWATGGKVYEAIARFSNWAMGLAGPTPQPWMAVASFLVLAAVAATLCWLLLRRATVHK